MSTTNVNSSNYIDLQSSINSTSGNAILLDNISDYYMLEDELIAGFSFLTKYDNILKSGLQDYTLDSEYYYRPEYISNNIFGTPDLWYVILYVNQMSSIQEFNIPTIKVPLSNTIEVINKLINYEDNISYSINEPKKIKRNLLKSLKADSDRVLSDYYNEKINPYQGTNLVSDLDSIISQKFIKKEIFFNTTSVVDENDKNISAFKPFTIDDTVSFPSNKFEEGISKKYYTGIRLQANNTYDFLFVQNGTTKIKLYNGSDQINLEKKFRPGKPKIVYDFRESNLDKIESYLNGTTLNFNSFNGKFNLEYNGNISSDEVDNMNLYNIKIDKNEIERLNLTRLKREDDILNPINDNNEDPGLSEEINSSNIEYTYYDYLFITVEYSSLYDTSKLMNNGFYTKITYDNNTIETFSNNLNDENYRKYYNTNDEVAKLTLPIKLNKNKKENIKSIEIISNVIILNNSSSNLKYNLYGIEIAGYLDKDFKEEFVPKNTGYYNIEIDYNYTKPFDRDIGGLLFDPKLRFNEKELSPVYYDIDSPLTYNNFFNGSFGEDLDSEEILYFNTNNLKLPNEYIINFLINMDISNKIGSLGFLFDSKFDSKNNLLGYLLILSNTPNIPTLLDISKDSDYSIIRPGLYKLDPYKIEDETKTYKFIYDNDSIYLNANLIQSLNLSDINNRDLKIIKKLNRITLCNKDDEGNWKYNDPLIPFIQDSSNYYYNNGIGFISLFHENSNKKSFIQIKDYFIYQ